MDDRRRCRAATATPVPIRMCPQPLNSGMGTLGAAIPGLVFYDTWKVAGDGAPGVTWSNSNPLAPISLYPDRRFDNVLSAWARRGGVGHPVRCALLGVRPPEQLQRSDHYGVVADLCS